MKSDGEIRQSNKDSVDKVGDLGAETPALINDPSAGSPTERVSSTVDMESRLYQKSSATHRNLLPSSLWVSYKIADCKLSFNGLSCRLAVLLPPKWPLFFEYPRFPEGQNLVTTFTSSK